MNNNIKNIRNVSTTEPEWKYQCSPVPHGLPEKVPSDMHALISYFVNEYFWVLILDRDRVAFADHFSPMPQRVAGPVISDKRL
jgi:hypothetical protein